MVVIVVTKKTVELVKEEYEGRKEERRARNFHGINTVNVTERWREQVSESQ